MTSCSPCGAGRFQNTSGQSGCYQCSTVFDAKGPNPHLWTTMSRTEHREWQDFSGSQSGGDCGCAAGAWVDAQGQCQECGEGIPAEAWARWRSFRVTSRAPTTLASSGAATEQTGHAVLVGFRHVRPWKAEHQHGLRGMRALLSYDQRRSVQGATPCLLVQSTLVFLSPQKFMWKRQQTKQLCSRWFLEMTDIRTVLCPHFHRRALVPTWACWLAPVSLYLDCCGACTASG